MTNRRHTKHVVDYNELKKYEMVQEIAGSYGRQSHKSLKMKVTGKKVTYVVYEHRKVQLETGSLKTAVKYYNELT